MHCTSFRILSLGLVFSIAPVACVKDKRTLFIVTCRKDFPDKPSVRETIELKANENVPHDDLLKKIDETHAWMSGVQNSDQCDGLTIEKAVR